MAEKITLKLMTCPTCGASLKATNSTDVIKCVYCGNSIVPVAEPATHKKESADGGVLRIEGIKTSSSALAYIEQFFEDYDWEAFAYAQSLSVSKINTLADSLKDAAADDKNTWFACFKAVYVPYLHKIEGCDRVLEAVIAAYKQDNLEAYSKFDAYKRIAAMIVAGKAGILAKLEKITQKAEKYGATAQEVQALRADMAALSAMDALTLYSDVEQIPAVKAFKQEKNRKIAQQLAAEGIDADSEYARAKALIEQKNFVQALRVLNRLEGYADSDELAEKIDKYYLLGDVLEICGTLYYFKKQDGGKGSLALHPTENGKIAEKPLVSNIGRIITNYADILYYLSGGGKLMCYDFVTKTEKTLYKGRLKKDTIWVRNGKVYLLTQTRENEEEEISNERDLLMLKLDNGAVTTVLEKIRSVESLTDELLVYKLAQKVEKKEDESSERRYKILTNIVDLETMDTVELGTRKVHVEGFVDNFVIYTQEAPNAYNRDLYIKALDSQEPELRLERNIYSFCEIIADKLFYYIGNSKNKTLVNINLDGTGRKEWPQFINRVLLEQGGWVYFTRKAAYDAVLCKARLDGSSFRVIAADIEEFVTLKNGYLYYINDSASLVRVRMDGSNLQQLCENVETVLTVKEDKILFISIDDRITEEVGEEKIVKNVKSIYAVDFTGSGKSKLAYNIVKASEYDENTVYYIASETIQTTEELAPAQRTTLHKLDVNTYREENLLNLEVQKAEEKISVFLLLAIFTGLLFFTAMLCFCAGVPLVGVLFLVGSICCLIAAILQRLPKEED